jgi:hypothetical protein
MGHPKPEPARLTVAQLAELQSDADGWRGVFRYADTFTDDDGDERFGALVFDLEGGEQTVIIAGPLDEEPGESLARMLNATGPLLSMLKLGASR